MRPYILSPSKQIVGRVIRSKVGSIVLDKIVMSIVVPPSIYNTGEVSCVCGNRLIVSGKR